MKRRRIFSTFTALISLASTWTSLCHGRQHNQQQLEDSFEASQPWHPLYATPSHGDHFSPVVWRNGLTGLPTSVVLDDGLDDTSRAREAGRRSDEATRGDRLRLTLTFNRERGSRYPGGLRLTDTKLTRLHEVADVNVASNEVNNPNLNDRYKRTKRPLHRRRRRKKNPIRQGRESKESQEKPVQTYGIFNPAAILSPYAGSGITDRSDCPGQCTNMVSCVMHGGRPLNPQSCPGIFDVCCSSWGNNYHSRQRRRKKKEGLQSRHKYGRALALPTFESISYSALPSLRDQRPRPPPQENNLYHSNFIDDTKANFQDVCGVSRSAQSRIMGGLDAGYGQFPWTAHIKIKGPGGIDKECGGTLINDQWILTAGHCTQYCASSVPTCAVEIPQHEITYKVILGEYDHFEAELFPPDQYLAIDVIRHPLYRNVMRVRENGFVESEPRYDVALLMLDRKVKLAPNVAPICMPETKEQLESVSTPGMLGTVVGWGRLGRAESAPHSNILQAATVPILSDSQCFLETGLLNFADQVCAGGSNSDSSACPGDSGGALQVQNDAGRWTLVGVVSNGPSICGLQPVVFHKLAQTLQWVKNTIERHTNSPVP